MVATVMYLTMVICLFVYKFSLNRRFLSNGGSRQNSSERAHAHIQDCTCRSDSEHAQDCEKAPSKSLPLCLKSLFSKSFNF